MTGDPTAGESGGVEVLRPTGRLNLVSAAEFKQQVEATVRDGHPRIVVDLAEVSFVDSSGLGAMVSGLKAARRAGGDLRIAAATAQVRSVLALTRLDRVLRPYDSVTEATRGW